MRDTGEEAKEQLLEPNQGRIMFGHLLNAFVLPQQEKENRLCTNKQKVSGINILILKVKQN